MISGLVGDGKADVFNQNMITAIIIVLSANNYSETSLNRTPSILESLLDRTSTYGSLLFPI